MKVHDRIHKSSPTIPRETNPVPLYQSILGCILVLSLQLCQDIQSRLFIRDNRNKPYMHSSYTSLMF